MSSQDANPTNAMSPDDVRSLLAEQEAGFDAAGYDGAWAARAKDTMW